MTVMDATPPAWVIIFLAAFAIVNHLAAYVYRVEFRSGSLPRAVGAFAVMLFYSYLQFNPDMSLELRSFIVRWCFVFLFLPEGYPITYLLTKRWVKHARND